MQAASSPTSLCFLSSIFCYWRLKSKRSSMISIKCRKFVCSAFAAELSVATNYCYSATAAELVVVMSWELAVGSWELNGVSGRWSGWWGMRHDAVCMCPQMWRAESGRRRWGRRHGQQSRPRPPAPAPAPAPALAAPRAHHAPVPQVPAALRPQPEPRRAPPHREHGRQHEHRHLRHRR